MSESIKSSRGFISGSTLKIIAMVFMFIDHFAAIVLDRYIVTYSVPNSIKIIYWVMRMLGRISFPIYVFLLIEGFHYTKSRAKYAVRLFLFCLISEIPFDLAFNKQILEFQYQNVFFTLWIGFMAIWIMDICSKRILQSSVKYAKVLERLSVLVILLLAMALAYYLGTDYDMSGILTIVAVYQWRDSSNVKKMALGCGVLTICMPVEITCFFDVLLIKFYNNKKGINLKYFFYLFYPCHILLLYGICVWLKI